MTDRELETAIFDLEPGDVQRAARLLVELEHYPAGTDEDRQWVADESRRVTMICGDPVALSAAVDALSAAGGA